MRFLSNIWVSNESEILFNRRVSHENISDFTANPASAESGAGELTAWPAFRRIVLPALASPNLAAPSRTLEGRTRITTYTRNEE